jgi:hypothetical protein
MAATKSSIVPASRKRFTGERKWLRAVRVYIRLANDALTLATAQPFHVLPGDSMHKHCALRSGSVLQFRRSLFGETLVTYRTFMKRPDDIWASLGSSPIYFINAGIYGRPKRSRVSFSTSCTIKQRRHQPDTGVAKSRRLNPCLIYLISAGSRRSKSSRVPGKQNHKPACLPLVQKILA